MMKYTRYLIVLISIILLFESCDFDNKPPKPRLCMFIGIDISGSFINSGYFDDSIDFLANYIYTHLNGLGGSEVPYALFVSSIGGAKADEPKTFFPIQTFQHKSVEKIIEKLVEIFPKEVENPFTDYNAFFEQIALTIKNKKMILRPISIVMLTDGKPDVKVKKKTDYRSIVVKPLESLSRNITIRLLYTSAEVKKNWETKVKRRRVKVWAQADQVMETWKEPNIMQPDKPLKEQNRFFDWLKDNVDFGVRSRRID